MTGTIVEVREKYYYDACTCVLHMMYMCCITLIKGHALLLSSTVLIIGTRCNFSPRVLAARNTTNSCRQRPLNSTWSKKSGYDTLLYVGSVNNNCRSHLMYPLSVHLLSDLRQWYPSRSPWLPPQRDFPSRWWHLCLHEGIRSSAFAVQLSL